MIKFMIILLLSIFYLLSSSFTVFAQEDSVGSTTQEIVENISSLDKPEAIPIETEEDCGFLGLGCLFAPKVDYTHEDLLPKEKHVTDLSLWEKIKGFFGLYEKSADPKTGYSYTYFPKEVDPAALGQGLADGTKTELVHKEVKRTLLPHQINLQNDLIAAKEATGEVAGVQLNQEQLQNQVLHENNQFRLEYSLNDKKYLVYFKQSKVKSMLNFVEFLKSQEIEFSPDQFIIKTK